MIAERTSEATHSKRRLAKVTSIWFPKGGFIRVKAGSRNERSFIIVDMLVSTTSAKASILPSTHRNRALRATSGTKRHVVIRFLTFGI